MPTTRPKVSMSPPTTLVIDQHAFAEILRHVLIDRGEFATATIQRRRTTMGRELIIAGWTRVRGIPDGRRMPPLTDWAVMTTNFDNRIPVERVAEIVCPRHSQLLVAIWLDPEDHGQFPVRLFEQGRVVRPDQVRFIGPGLLRLPESKRESYIPAAIADAELRRSRTRGALRKLYDRLVRLSVMLVGFGRGGGELARQLVAAGVRHLIGFDGDRMGPENLDAAPDTPFTAVGEYKIIDVCRRLRRNQPELTAVCVPHSVTAPKAVRMLSETRVDTVFSFVDNQAARLAVSQSCRQSRTIHVDVGTLIRYVDGQRNMSADIRLFEPGRGCVACVPPMPENELDDALYALSAPAGALMRGSRVNWDELRAGSLLHLNALACSIAIEVWLAYLAGEVRSSHWVRVVWPFGETPRIVSSDVDADAACRFCFERV